ncbi:MAG: hypothetical protein GC157_12270 [Frankiales bacterium]|nr:hypothetical protein [Frankiales bacterium]
MTARALDVGDGWSVGLHEVGSGAGPVLAVLGGVHGDELEGVVAARRVLALAERLAGEGRLSGTLRVVPVCNPPAFEAQTRTSPVDDANLARVFPGSAQGTVTSRIAHHLTHEVIRGADLMVDLHSAGLHYSMPVFAGYVDGVPTAPRSAEAAAVFDAPLLWRHEGSGEGRSMSAAESLGVPSIYVEGSGGGGLVGTDVDVYVRGVTRLLSWLGMTPDHLAPPSGARLLSGDDGDVDASLTTPVAGLCVTRVTAGDVVQPGQLVAEVLDDRAELVHEVRNPRPEPASVMMLRRTARVVAGDGIAMLGPVPRDLPGVPA